MVSRVRLQQILIVMSLVACGCGRQTDRWLAARPATAPASGEVTFGGKPLEGAIVIFQPTAPGGIGASALTDDKGGFKLQTFPPKLGAVPGTYSVSIMKTEMPPAGTAPADEGGPVLVVSAIPEKYAVPTESGLVAVIPESGTEDLVFHLKP
jgi:hypothetical protein